MTYSELTLLAPPRPAANRYGRLCTEVYELDKPPGALADVGYYLSRLSALDGPVLEAGCGSGRLLIPLAEAGHDVSGFDRSPDMLEACRRQCAARGLSADLRQASFQDFVYDRSFGAILAPVGTFTLIDSFDEALAVLARAFDHLRPGGRLMIDLPPLGHLAHTRSDVRSWRAANGDLLRLEAGSVEIDFLAQRRTTHDRYERWREGRLVETELEIMAFRLWGAREFELALRAVGFGEIVVWADYRPGRQLHPASRIWNFEALRPA